MVAAERERPAVQARRAEFIAELKTIDAARLVFLDESGSHIGMARTHGRSRCGQRLHHALPRNRGTVLTMIGAISLDGIETMMTNIGGTNAAVFRRFVDDHLVPVLREGDVVVMDNLGAHHATGIRAAIEVSGARVIYQPPYSPDLNPIEPCWSKVKSILRQIGARTVKTLTAAVHRAAKLVTADDADGWFDTLRLPISARLIAAVSGTRSDPTSHREQRREPELNGKAVIEQQQPQSGAALRPLLRSRAGGAARARWVGQS